MKINLSDENQSNWSHSGEWMDADEAQVISSQNPMRDCDLFSPSQASGQSSQSLDLKKAKVIIMKVFAEQMWVWNIDKQPVWLLEMLKRAQVTPCHPHLPASRHTEALFMILHNCFIAAVSHHTHHVGERVCGVARPCEELHAGVNEV